MNGKATSHAAPVFEHEGLHPQLQRLESRALRIGGAGVLLLALGFFLDSEQFFRSYLLGYLFWIGLTIGSLGLLSLHHIVGGGWTYVIRRCLEAASSTMPLLAILFLPILAGMDSLYPWTDQELVASDHVLHHKAPYLNVPFFAARFVFYFAVWGGAAFLMTAWSARQDESDDVSLSKRLRRIGAPSIVLAILTASFASFDWLMSLDPHWFSTLFGLWFLVGSVLTALAFVICLLYTLQDRKPLSDVLTVNHFHDLGNLTMAFVMLWAYLSFSQFLIIWSGNLKEETPWYLHRLDGGWSAVALLLVVFHFAVPFVVLLSRRTKRVAKTLVKVSVFLLVMRWVDLAWQVVPNFHHQFFVSWMDVVTPAAIGGVWMTTFARHLKNKPLLPLRDPGLREVFEGSGGHP